MNLINKDTFRDIKKSYSRFLSILLIVALGVFIFIGLITTGTIMRDSLDKLVKEQNYEDIMITSSLEFENKDIRLIESLDNIEELEYAYDQDLSVKGDVLLLKLTNMPFKINGNNSNMTNINLVLSNSDISHNYAGIYVSSGNVKLDNLKINFTVPLNTGGYGIFVDNANNFKLLNSNIQFIGNNKIGLIYNYGLKIKNSHYTSIKGC